MQKMLTFKDFMKNYIFTIINVLRLKISKTTYNGFIIYKI